MPPTKPEILFSIILNIFQISFDGATEPNISFGPTGGPVNKNYHVMNARQDDVLDVSFMPYLQSSLRSLVYSPLTPSSMPGYFHGDNREYSTFTPSRLVHLMQ